MAAEIEEILEGCPDGCGDTITLDHAHGSPYCTACGWRE